MGSDFVQTVEAVQVFRLIRGVDQQVIIPINWIVTCNNFWVGYPSLSVRNVVQNVGDYIVLEESVICPVRGVSRRLQNSRVPQQQELPQRREQLPLQQLELLQLLPWVLSSS